MNVWRLYLIHLVIPVLILVDLALAAQAGHFANGLGWTPIAIATLAAAWLAIGVSAPVVFDRQRFLGMVSGPLLLVYAVVMVMMIGEAAARSIPPSAQSRRTFLRKPGSVDIKMPENSVTPGISGRALFTVNDIGLRGPSAPQSSGVYQIAALGGSTTEGLFLDDSEEWPHLLMTGLREQSQIPVTVMNGGVAGQTSAHTLALLQSVPVLRHNSMLIFIVGINDLQATLELGGAPTETLLNRSATAFLDGKESPGERNESASGHAPFYERSVLWWQYVRPSAVYQWARRAVVGHDAGEDDPAGRTWLGAVRGRRVTAATVPLPDLRTGIEEYQDRIHRMALECHRVGSRCLFVTQPTMWRSDLTASESGLLWFGWVGPQATPKGYVAVAQLAAAMNRYNQALLDTCEQDSLECFDLAAVVPKDTSALYDDCHFNENGARIVARQLTQYLLSTPPFKRSPAD